MTDDTDTRRKNYCWTVRKAGDAYTTDMNRQFAVLMDIRDELQDLNSLLRCPNFTGMPQVLKRIDRRLAKRIPMTKRKGR